MPAMADMAFPKPSVPGPSLAELRRSQGVSQASLAQRLGLSRITLHVWERSAEVDPIRAAKYERALREIVAEAVA